MSDDEPDHELLALLRQHMQGKLTIEEEPETGVLEGAEFVCDNSIDVSLDMRSCKNAAAAIYEKMQQKQFSPATWSTHELHPNRHLVGAEAAVAFVFVMDLLNFSFWSERSEEERFTVDYRGKRWTGYWSLVAGLQRALEEGRSHSLVRLAAAAVACSDCWCPRRSFASWPFFQKENRSERDPD